MSNILNAKEAKDGILSGRIPYKIFHLFAWRKDAKYDTSAGASIRLPGNFAVEIEIGGSPFTLDYGLRQMAKGSVVEDNSRKAEIYPQLGVIRHPDHEGFIVLSKGGGRDLHPREVRLYLPNAKQFTFDKETLKSVLKLKGTFHEYVGKEDGMGQILKKAAKI